MSKDSVNLNITRESRGTLWNIIFEGFDQEVVLITNFYGETTNTIGILHNFANLIDNNFKDCFIGTTDKGLVIKKYLPTNDASQINKWKNLMFSLRYDMRSITNAN